MYDLAVSAVDRPEVAPRAPEAAEAPPRGGGADLRLAITKSGIGLEIGAPIALACARVTELWLRLPQVRFPFDVSGGVARFRHKRGTLTRLMLEVDWDDAARWAAPRLSGIVAPGAAEAFLAPDGEGGALLSLRSRPRSPEDALVALAFRLAVLPRDAGLDLIVHDARGVGLRAPPTLLALTAMGRLVGKAATRRGCVFSFERAALDIARHVLPDAGARVPDVADVRLAVCSAAQSGVVVAFAEAPACEPSAAGVTAREAGELLLRADDALVAGDLDHARRELLAALERAPRQLDASRRLAEIDAHAGGRAEAALATLRDAGADAKDGLLRAALAREAGDDHAAIAAFTAWASREPAPWVAALALARAAEISPVPDDALRWLDEAIAIAPTLANLRWVRAERRLAAGLVADGVSDLEHLEAMAQGAREKHESARRAASLLARTGLPAEATRFLERALRFDPEDPVALAGLGVALASAGRPARGAALLARAIDEAEARREPTDRMLLDLAALLADALSDLPSAIARARAVRDDTPVAWQARALEARLRARFGDVEGASLAYARMRELATATGARDAVAALEEAAAHARERGDAAGERQHKNAALALSPKDPRHVDREGSPAEVPPPAAPARDEAPTDAAPPAPAEVDPLDEAEAEARVATLTQTLQVDPTRDDVVDELVTLLTRLGRGHELFALLSARLEDAPPDRRAALVPRQREILTTLAEDAERDGRADEAALFRMALEALA